MEKSWSYCRRGTKCRYATPLGDCIHETCSYAKYAKNDTSTAKYAGNKAVNRWYYCKKGTICGHATPLGDCDLEKCILPDSSNSSEYYRPNSFRNIESKCTGCVYIKKHGGCSLSACTEDIGKRVLEMDLEYSKDAELKAARERIRDLEDTIRDFCLELSKGEKIIKEHNSYVERLIAEREELLKERELLWKKLDEAEHEIDKPADCGASGDKQIMIPYRKFIEMRERIGELEKLLQIK